MLACRTEVAVRITVNTGLNAVQFVFRGRTIFVAIAGNAGVDTIWMVRIFAVLTLAKDIGMYTGFNTV